MVGSTRVLVRQLPERPRRTTPLTTRSAPLRQRSGDNNGPLRHSRRACDQRETGCGLSASEVSVIFMGLAKKVITPWGVVAFTAMAVLTYILWQGPERFYYESFGTWIISPGIYVRLLPFPLNEWLLTALRHIPLLASALHLAPVALLALSFALSLYSIWNKTVVHAFISLGLAAAVFSAYHFLQPFGIELIRY